jgi:ABC-type Na+ efflux pump permease subunit
MSETRSIALLVGASIVFGVIALSAAAQSRNPDTATIRVAYYQAFTNPMNATCRNPTRRKVKTSSGYKWRWVC